jgi:hypothetical protein
MDRASGHGPSGNGDLLLLLSREVLENLRARVLTKEDP